MSGLRPLLLLLLVLLLLLRRLLQRLHSPLGNR